MREKYEEILKEVEELARKNFALAEVLQGYCEYFVGEKVSSSFMAEFFKEIKERQQEIIYLIDKKTTEIGYQIYLNQN